MCSEYSLDTLGRHAPKPEITRSRLRKNFLVATTWRSWNIQPLRADASFRRYFRLTLNNQSVLLMDSPPKTEAIDSFVKIDEYLISIGLRAPQIYALDIDNGFAIIEDFGTQTYTELLDAGAEAEPLYRLAIDALGMLHKGLPVDQLEIPRYDEGYYDEEAALFIDWYWPARTGEKASANLRREFFAIWAKLLAELSREDECMVLRDYHVDNLMLIDGEEGLNSCGLLDFQDALIGSRAYDAVSLFEDARRHVDQRMAKRLLGEFQTGLSPAARAAFNYDYSVLGTHRHMKVVGIFVRLGVRDGKGHYLNHLPRVQRLLEASLSLSVMKPLADWVERNHPGKISEPLTFDTDLLHNMLCIDKP
jgi:aminoglycoside/choline kinase family phosphotransferase